MLVLALLPAGALAAHWSDEYIQTATVCGWIEADDADPGREVTRAEAAEILSKAANSAVTAGENADGPLTRQDAVVMLADAFGLEAADKSAAAGFTDWADVSDAARDAMAAAVEQGIVNGVGGNRLAPNQVITLGELIKIAAVTVEKTADHGHRRRDRHRLCGYRRRQALRHRRGVQCGSGRGGGQRGRLCRG